MVLSKLMIATLFTFLVPCTKRAIYKLSLTCVVSAEKNTRDAKGTTFDFTTDHPRVLF